MHVELLYGFNRKPILLDNVVKVEKEHDRFYIVGIDKVTKEPKKLFNLNELAIEDLKIW